MTARESCCVLGLFPLFLVSTLALAASDEAVLAQLRGLATINVRVVSVGLLSDSSSLDARLACIVDQESY